MEQHNLKVTIDGDGDLKMRLPNPMSADELDLALASFAITHPELYNILFEVFYKLGRTPCNDAEREVRAAFGRLAGGT